ncbi:hypothetical protein J0910_00550 [Nocardiopsis sp. CNT-189]|uniref:hypothetical protein n=1 Tax=Nocardiopsis oceanisediminis TaxID=2816862 RepID=UPI003B2BB4CC
MLSGISDRTVDHLRDCRDGAASRAADCTDRAAAADAEADRHWGQAEAAAETAREYGALIAAVTGTPAASYEPQVADRQARLLRTAARLAADHPGLPAPEWSVDAEARRVHGLLWRNGCEQALAGWARALDGEVQDTGRTDPTTAFQQVAVRIGGVDVVLTATVRIEEATA